MNHGDTIDLLVCGSPQFFEMLTESVEDLKNKKADEFGPLGLKSIEKFGDIGDVERKRLMSDTFICFCDQRDGTAVANFLHREGYSVPLFILLESYDTARMDEVFGHPYLHTRGYFHKDTLDPEEVGHVIRVVKGSYRQFRERRGDPSSKKIGWKIRRTEQPGDAASMVSLFLDPTMREFMQQLLFAIESVRSEDLSSPEITKLRDTFARIGELHSENRKGDGKDAERVERDARKILSKDAGNLIAKPQPILLEGETGVGKTLIAAKIHQILSKIKDQELPFQRISTVNIGENILESELFGLLHGAWTDSVNRIGKLLMGCGGVVFLDEIGDLPPKMQAKLLVYLDSFEFQPDGWGYDWKIYAPCYIVAATNKDLVAAVEKGDFRSDLYHRFTHRLTVPALRERRHDIRALIDFVLQNPEINRVVASKPELRRWVNEISHSALARLEEHRFPGNFRELESIISKAIFRARQDGRDIIFEEDLEF